VRQDQKPITRDDFLLQIDEILDLRPGTTSRQRKTSGTSYAIRSVVSDQTQNMTQEQVIVRNENHVVKKTRLSDLDRAKGLAILLVVVGHIVARNGPNANSWYMPLKLIIYTFHMPFFMYLSGFVAFRSSLLPGATTETFHILKRKAKRLIVPFFFFGAVIVLGKHLVSRFIYIDNLTYTALSDGLNIFWDTGKSAALSIWYLYVLFAYWVITTPIVLARKKTVFLLAVLAIVIYWVTLPDRLYLPQIGKFYIFFLLGGVAAYFEDTYLHMLDRMIYPAIFVFLICLGMFYLHLGTDVQMLISGVASIPAIHGFMRTRPATRMQVLLVLGKYCMVIYLLNTIFIGLTKGIMFRFFSWDGNRFVVFFVMLGISGLFLPILMKEYVFSHVRFLNSITD